jgi:uncharacterized membrane protein
VVYHWNELDAHVNSYLSKEVVTSAHSAIFQAIIDLTQLGFNLNLDFGFCNISILRKDLRYSYKVPFVQQLNFSQFENKVRGHEHYRQVKRVIS